MKISIVRITLHRGSGQVTHIYELTCRLRRLGHQVAIFSRRVEEGVDLPNVFQVETFLDDLPFIRHFSFALKVGVGMRRFDLVHTQYHPGIFTGDVSRIFRGKPHIFTFHGFAPIEFWRNPIQRIKTVDHRSGTFFGLRFGVDHVITVSRFLKRELVESYRFNPEKIDVIYNGVDAERFSPDVDSHLIREKYGIEDEPLVLFLGRLAPYKGPQFLIMAAPRILEEIPDARFIIAGSSRYDEPQLRLLARKLDVEEACIFTGYVADEEVPSLYTASDVFCYPSLWEGFGITPAEAQACGRPVVAFNHCALPEVVGDNETGILVPPMDHKALAEALIELLSDKKRRIEMGRRGRRRVVEKFSWDKAVEETLEVYNRVLEDF